METVVKVFDTVWPLVAAGAGLTLVTQLAKRLSRIEKSGVARTLFHAFTFLFTAATWWMNHSLGLYSLVLHGASYSGFGSALYPVVKRLDSWLTDFAHAIKLARQYEPQLTKIAQDVESATGVGLNPADAPAAQTPPAPAAADF